MSRLAHVTGDARLADKARGLFAEWARTVKPDGDARMRHYPFDKLVGGLVDLQKYGGVTAAAPMLARVVAFAQRHSIGRSCRWPIRSHNQHYYGLPQEWYTLSENLYRAYRLTGDEAYRKFGDEWRYRGVLGEVREQPRRRPTRTASTLTATPTRSAARRWRSTSPAIRST